MIGVCVCRLIIAQEGAFLAVLTYKDTGGGRVYNHPRPYINDVYSNDPHHLVRIDVDFAQADGTSEVSGARKRLSSSAVSAIPFSRF